MWWSFDHQITKSAEEPELVEDSQSASREAFRKQNRPEPRAAPKAQKRPAREEGPIGKTWLKLLL